MTAGLGLMNWGLSRRRLAGAVSTRPAVQRSRTSIACSRESPVVPSVTSTAPARMLAVLRILAAVVFISFGTMKLFGFPPPPAIMPPVTPITQLWIAGVLETFGGAAILLGLFTRPVAFVLSGEMAVAYFQSHFPQSVYPTTNMGTPAILYCLLYLYLAFAGAGAWSLDAMIARSRGGHRA